MPSAHRKQGQASTLGQYKDIERRLSRICRTRTPSQGHVEVLGELCEFLADRADWRSFIDIGLAETIASIFNLHPPSGPEGSHSYHMFVGLLAGTSMLLISVVDREYDPLYQQTYVTIGKTVPLVCRTLWDQVVVYPAGKNLGTLTISENSFVHVKNFMKALNKFVFALENRFETSSDEGNSGNGINANNKLDTEIFEILEAIDDSFAYEIITHIFLFTLQHDIRTEFAVVRRNFPRESDSDQTSDLTLRYFRRLGMRPGNSSGSWLVSLNDIWEELQGNKWFSSFKKCLDPIPNSEMAFQMTSMPLEWLSFFSTACSMPEADSRPIKIDILPNLIDLLWKLDHSIALTYYYTGVLNFPTIILKAALTRSPNPVELILDQLLQKDAAAIMATFTLHKIEYLEEREALESDSELEDENDEKSQLEVFLLTAALNYIVSHGLDSVPNRLVRKVQRRFRPLWFKTMVHISSVFHLVDDGSDDDAEHSDNDDLDLGPTKQDLIARQWRKLGKLLEFTDPDDDMAGCSWKKCVLHNREGPQMMRKCKGCYGAQYCGKTCQKRDWVEGTHKTACR